MPATKIPQLVHRLSPLTIFLPLLILFGTTVFLLFFSSNENVSAIWSQCSSTTIPGLLPRIYPIPIIGQVSCYMITFFYYAIASSRAFVVMSVILSFVTALLTITLVESARIFNQPSILIRSPTVTLLLFNLAAGAVAWQGIIVPSFIHRSRRAERVRNSAQKPSLNIDSVEGKSTSLLAKREPRDPNRGAERRHLHSSSEIYAIPLAVIIGYVIPSLIWLFAPSPTIIIFWLFFPLWVSLVRQLIRCLLILLPLFPQFTGDQKDTIHLESNTRSLILAYSTPVILSIISHAILFNNLQQPDDSSPTTRAALAFIEIDFAAIAVTVYYWLLLEAGWKILGLTIAASLAAGPGAGLVLGWILREGVSVA